MKILVFGGSGQLGREILVRGADLDFEVVSPVQSEIDIAEQDQVTYLINQIKPELIINCAAYTAVDNAEANPDLAYKTNRDGAMFVAKAAAQVQCRMIHISTDYVFPGTGRTPLSEEDQTNPPNVYGASKLAGEEEVLSRLKEKGLIVRTSSLHGQYGANFVHTMLSLFDQGKEVQVVEDQWMSPTWAGFLAEVLLDLARLQSVHGVIHCSCAGTVTWHEFASEILKIVYHGDKQHLLKAIALSENGRPAKRPQFSAFNLSKLQSILRRPPMPWKEGLKNHLRGLKRIT